MSECVLKTKYIWGECLKKCFQNLNSTISDNNNTANDNHNDNDNENDSDSDL